MTEHCSAERHQNRCHHICFHHRYLVSGADDSSLYLEVKSVEGNNVKCTAQNDAVMDGLLTVTHHSANEEDRMSMQADLPLLSEHDVHAIRDITSQFEVDFVALTFTRDGEDVDGLRDFLDKLGLEQTKILAKVENQAALYNFASIATAADGVIISRGNLGLDVAPEKMARVQKEVVSKCNLLGKPVIITRVVDTMATAPRPTRYAKLHCLLIKNLMSNMCMATLCIYVLTCTYAVSRSNKAVSKPPWHQLVAMDGCGIHGSITGFLSGYCALATAQPQIQTHFVLSRAEATDVANAVLDGTDGVLLGAETLRGKYPAITVKTVLAICRQAEQVFDYSGHFEWLTLQGEMVCKCYCYLYLTQCLQERVQEGWMQQQHFRPLFAACAQRFACVPAHMCLRLSTIHCPTLLFCSAFPKADAVNAIYLSRPVRLFYQHCPAPFGHTDSW